ATSVQHIRQVLTFHRKAAEEREIGNRRRLEEKRLPGLLPRKTRGKKHMGSRAKQIRNAIEGFAQALEEVRGDRHVVIEQTHVAVPRGAQPDIHGNRKEQRLTMVDRLHLWKTLGQHLHSAVGGAVVDHDRFADLYLIKHLRQHAFEHFPTV